MNLSTLKFNYILIKQVVNENILVNSSNNADKHQGHLVLPHQPILFLAFSEDVHIILFHGYVTFPKYEFIVTYLTILTILPLVES